MSALRRFGPAMALLLLLPVLWLGVLRAGGELSAQPASTWLRYYGRTFSFEELIQLEKSEEESGEALPFSAFAQLDARTVKSGLYNRSVQADILLFYGDLRRILRAGMPQEDFAFSADRRGCALDRDTAFALWGSDRVVGEKLLFEETEYTVRAVLDGPKGTVAIPLSQGMEHTLSQIALSVPEGRDAGAAAEEFALRHALPTPDALTGGGWPAGAARFFCLLPALPLLFHLLRGIIRELWGMRETPVLCALWCLVTAAVLALCYLLCGVRLSFPQSLTPTRWSDFEFWRRLLQGFFQNMRTCLLMPVLAPDRATGAALIRLIPFSLFATADMAALLALWKRGQGQG